MKILIVKTVPEDIFETFFSPENLEYIHKVADVSVYHYYDGTKEDLKREISDADVVMTMWGIDGKLDKEILDCAEKLKIIAQCGGTASPVINDEVIKRKIKVITGNRILAEGVAEGTICYIFAAQKKLDYLLNTMRMSGWQGDKGYCSYTVKGKTVGIYGYGMIARHVVRMLSIFGVKIKVCAEYDIPKEDIDGYEIETCGLEELFETSDIISLHAGMTEDKYHIIDEKMLARMKDNALLINTARGALIDEKALENELSTGRIRAVLDVYETEPLPMTSPLRKFENVMLMPHRADAIETRIHIVRELVEDILGFFEGDKILKHEIDYDYIKHQTVEDISQKLIKKI